MIAFSICPQTAEVSVSFDEDHDILTRDELVEALQMAYLVGFKEGVGTSYRAMLRNGASQGAMNELVMANATHEAICHRIGGGRAS